MARSQYIAVAAATVLLLGLGSSATAQKASRSKRSKQWTEKREKVRQKIRTMRAWRLTEALNLDERTAEKLFPILNEYDEKFAKLARTTRKTRRALKQELDAAKPDPKRIDTLVDAMEKQHEKYYEWERDRFRAVRKVLTPEQTGRIVIVLPKLDRTIHREIRKAMRGKNGRKRPAH